MLNLEGASRSGCPLVEGCVRKRTVKPACDRKAMLTQGARQKNTVCPIETRVPGRKQIISLIFLIRNQLSTLYQRSIIGAVSLQLLDGAAICRGIDGRHQYF